uniref:arylsulfatase n=2 Tax=Leucobacter soli TaxID=2812850 RepID=UPI0022A751D4|nr:arylsulfatase [Leucobacter soli]
MAGDPRAGARGYERFPHPVTERAATTERAWRRPRSARPGAPNVVLILADDLGFSDVGAYGSEIRTPHLDALADTGVTYTNYHTNPVCSPARASLLTGINSHRAGFAEVAHADPGLPNNVLELPDDAPTIAESFQAAGYATIAIGKWHLAKESHMHEGADQHSWPVQRGFDRYFGHLDGFSQLFHPHRLYVDNSLYEPDPDDDSYLTDVYTDRAIGYLSGLRANEPEKPFFLYLAHTAVHAPLQAKEEDISRYRGVYEAGWQQLREERFAAQRALGIVDEHAELPDEDPDFEVAAWDELSASQRELYARYMSVYAGAVDNMDQNLGRLIEHLKASGDFENTIFAFASDNGASGEGGPEGTRSYLSKFVHDVEPPESWRVDLETPLEEVGGPRSAIHYPRGWARVSATPYRYFKGHTYGGGVRAPLIISWQRGIGDAGGGAAAESPAAAPADGGSGRRINRNFAHVTDLGVALLELAGVEPLAARHGRPAMEFDGRPEAILGGVLAGREADADRVQYWECYGHRALVRGRHKIVTEHEPGRDFAADAWRLYDLDADPTERIDLAGGSPELTRELGERWVREAWANTVFPINDDGRAGLLRPSFEQSLSEPITLAATTPPLERYRSSRLIALRSFAVIAEFGGAEGGRAAEAAGVLVAHGDQGGGYLLAVEGGEVVFVYNEYGRRHRIAVPVPPEPADGAPVRVVVRAEATEDLHWRIALEAGGRRAELPPVMQFVGLAPFSGISVGRDAGNPVDWSIRERRGEFPFTGRLVGVRYEPGDPAPYNETVLVDVLAEQARLYD